MVAVVLSGVVHLRSSLTYLLPLLFSLLNSLLSIVLLPFFKTLMVGNNYTASREEVRSSLPVEEMTEAGDLIIINGLLCYLSTSRKLHTEDTILNVCLAFYSLMIFKLWKMCYLPERRKMLLEGRETTKRK